MHRKGAIVLNENVNESQLESLISTGNIVFIDFWAEWCAPCKVFSKVYSSIAQQYPDIIFAKVNIEQESSLAETFHIRSIPHLIVFKEGVVIYSESGSIPESALKDLVVQVLKIDISKIREDVEKGE